MSRNFLAANGLFLRTTAGFSSLYAVVLVFFYYDWLSDLPIATNALLYEGMLNGCLCIGACVVVLAMVKRISLLFLVGAGCVFYIAAFVFVCLAETLGFEMLVYVAAACAGIAAGVLVPLWFAAIGRMGKKGFGYVLGVSSLACGFVVIAVNAFPTMVTMATGVALLVLSFAMLFDYAEEKDIDSDGLPFACFAAMLRGRRLRFRAHASDAPRESKARSSQLFDDAKQAVQPLVLPSVYVVLLSVVYGALDEAAVVGVSFSTAETGVIYQICGIATDAFFLAYVRFGKGRFLGLFNVVVAIVATGLVFLPFLPPVYAFMLLVLVHAGWGLALLVSYALTIETLRERPLMLVAVAAVVFALPRPGVVVGAWAASLIVSDGFAFAQTTALAFLLLYVTMAGIWAVRTREKRAADRAIRKRDDLIRRYAQARDDLYEMVCSDMAKDMGLTRREGELLYFYAQGRDAAYIESELCLSRNTVKSYTKSLYAKTGVHSRQELIDLVKANVPSA